MTSTEEADVGVNDELAVTEDERDEAGRVGKFEVHLHVSMEQ
jgi:hypothetical protein